MVEKCGICGKFLSEKWGTEDQDDAEPPVCSRCVKMMNAECEEQMRN